jgi:hypothetical protein
MEKLRKDELINEVTHRIESNFNDSIVRWLGTGSPDEDDADVERFEVLWITDEDYSRFRDFVWDLEVNLAEPNGFALMVHCLSPKATQEHRLNEYLGANYEKLSKNISYTIRMGSEILVRFLSDKTTMAHHIINNSNFEKYLLRENFIDSTFFMNWVKEDNPFHNFPDSESIISNMNRKLIGFGDKDQKEHCQEYSCAA